MADAIAATTIVESRALCPRAAVNLNANGRGALLGPTYSSDIALAWDLCNRGFGFGADTNPSPFDPTVTAEVSQCDVEVRVSGTLVRTATVNVRPKVATTIDTAAAPDQFDLTSTTGFQAGDRISVVNGTNSEFFGRIASISGSTVTLVSPLPFTPSGGQIVNRYEAIGYVYDSATNTADNGSLADQVDFTVYPKLNGLRALAAETLSVIHI